MRFIWVVMKDNFWVIYVYSVCVLCYDDISSISLRKGLGIYVPRPMNVIHGLWPSLIIKSSSLVARHHILM